MQEKFCLIGKEISHSASKEVYEKLLSRNISYTLLDCKSTDQIPPLEELYRRFSFISITSPYKRFFFDKVSFEDIPKGISSLNTLRFNEGKFEGTNTDYWACRDILSELQREHAFKNLVILGDGAMREVISHVFLELEMGESLGVYSRKMTSNFEKLDLSSLGENLLVINTCLRQFMFQGKLPYKSLFWDLNYNVPPFSQEGVKYLDGKNLLYFQAKYACKFWGL